ncbi:branched-chain amino acid ABC transporter substrate-binding protein [Hyphomicrobium sp.]|uniref:branched-chain amino acid ABC transporter substrate-binding protein n=1 Tax=Hyphomicrobium sp. TaxID=82 RepID=UPI002E307456|nr:branched-chain amino acid ABC transporter substrate-binding protein [Hyphomicrobium sp.]HEX2843176.1 branched-chain amino acid ABC transporter substrate-binding protein [Hyphomicrobium sp.]
MRFVKLAAALFATLALASCGGEQKLKIGVAGPITGKDAVFGAQLKHGAEQAVEDINAAGGLNGQKIELVVGDDAADPKQGRSVANMFVSEGVSFVIGHFNSGVSEPASDVYSENGILMITPGSTNPKITERSLKAVFRTCGRDDQQGKVAGEYIAQHFKDKKVAIAHDKTTYGKGLADETKKTMNGLGVTEVLYEGVNTGERDFSALVSKIKASGADIVYWGGVHTEGGAILRQMRAAGVNATMMGGDGIATDEFAALAGPGTEGTLMTFGPDPQKRPEAQAVLEKFKARNFKPEAYTLYSYASVQVIAEAAKAINSVDPAKIAEELHKGKTYKTVIGDLAFDAKGDVTRIDYVMYTWQKQPDGTIAYVQN